MKSLRKIDTRASRAASTRRVYDSDWAHFAAWCAARGRTALPAPAETVAVYLGTEADRGLAPPTIGRKLAAIGWRHRAFGHLPPQQGEAGLAILSVMAGIRRAPHPAPVRKSAADADVVRDTLKAITGETLHDHRDRAVIGFGMLSALRRSELVAITLADIERRPEGLLIHVRRSKADQEGKGAAVPVPAGRRIRPVALLDAWLDAAGITEGPVFRRISRCGTKVHNSAMAAQAVAHIVQARVAAAGYDPALFGAHSRHYVAPATALDVRSRLGHVPYMFMLWVAFMAQHFLLSAAARSLSPAKVARMSDRGAENVFLRLRWPETDGKPVCPTCGCQVCYDCRRPAGQARWRCKACGADFSVTSGTLFAWHKLPLRAYLMAIAVFCNEVKGKSMLAFARDIDVQYKTAFVLAHKLREAMASSTKAMSIGGEGRTAEIDGAYFGGHIRPENLAIDRIDRRLAENQSGKRQVVVAMRERGGRTLAQVFAAEADAVAAIRQRVIKGTTVHADESAAWNPLHASFAMQRINHQDGFSIDGACTNATESYFSRLRRGELGHHHHIAGPYLVRYAREAAWREDFRRVSNGEQVFSVVGLAMRCRPSVDFCGYWQRARAA